MKNLKFVPGDGLAEGDKDFILFPTQPKYTEGQTILYSFLIASSWVSIGYAISYSSNAQIVYEKGKILSSFYSDFYGSFIFFGAAIGSLLNGIVIFYGIGYKKSSTISGGIFVIGWLLHILILSQKFDGNTSKSAGIIIFGRFTIGIAVGISTQCTPIYIAEITPSHQRHTLGMIPGLMINIGYLLGYAVGYIFLKKDYDNAIGLDALTKFDIKTDFFSSLTYPPLLGVFLAALSMLFLAFCPYIKPKGLLFNGDATSLNSTEGAYTEKELPHKGTDIDRITAASGRSLICIFKSTWRNITTTKVGKQLVVAILGMLINQAMGINAIINNSTSIFLETFSSEPNNPSEASRASCFLGLALFISVFGVVFCNIFLKNKSTLYISSSIISFCLLFIGTYFYRKWQNPSFLTALVLIYVFFYNSGWAIIPWLVMSQIFDENVKNIGSAITTVWSYIFCFIITVTYNPMVGIVGQSGIFLLYFIVSMLSFPYICFIMPETKGKNYREIQEIFT